MHKKTLITGASGLVGSRLTELLQQKGYQVSHLSRQAKGGAIPVYQWDSESQLLDPRAFENCESIIHLAGAGIADKPWTKERKKEIIESRTLSTKLLYTALKQRTHSVTTFVSASAIGYYGYAGSEEIFTEESKAANDFLADVVKQWEEAVDQIATLGIRVVKIRIGILLSEKGGALKELLKPIKWGIGSPLGTGNQFMSWIHMDDVCGIFIRALEDDEMTGVYNAVSPSPVTNEQITKAIAKVLKKPLWLPNVPPFLLNLVLGEMADLVVKGSKVSADKIQRAGYQFLYPDLSAALQNLLIKNEKS